MQPVLHMCAGNQGLEIVLFKQIVWKVHYPNTLIPLCLTEYMRAEYTSILGWNLCYAWMHHQKGINQWYLAEMMGTYGMVTCLQGSAVPHGFRQCTLSQHSDPVQWNM